LLAKLQTWIDGLAFESEGTEDAFVDAPKRFLANESLRGFDAKSEFTECQGTLGGNGTTAQTLQVLGQQVFRPIDNSQVLRAPALDGGLRQRTPSAHNKVQRLDDYAFTASCG
jgi:hypothetical protein